MRDVNDFKRLWEDEDFRASVHPDHKNFADETKSGISIGYRTRFIAPERHSSGRLKN
jgi:hypothetical protein